MSLHGKKTNVTPNYTLQRQDDDEFDEKAESI